MSYDADVARARRLLPLVKEGFAASLTEAATRFDSSLRCLIDGVNARAHTGGDGLSPVTGRVASPHVPCRLVRNVAMSLARAGSGVTGGGQGAHFRDELRSAAKKRSA